MIYTDINLLAVFVAGVAHMVVGMLWYSPVLFGNVWKRLMGIDDVKMEEMKKKGMGKTMGISFVVALITAYALAYLLVLSGITSAGAAAALGLIVGVGFVFTTGLTTVLYEERNTHVYLINAAYHTASFAIMAAVLTLF